MKNKFRFLGIIAIIAIIGLSMVSCGDDELKLGGSFTIKNETGGTIRAYALGWKDLIKLGLNLENITEDLIKGENGKDIPNGKSETWKFPFDDSVRWGYLGLVSDGYIAPTLKTGKEEIKGGNSNSIIAPKETE